MTNRILIALLTLAFAQHGFSAETLPKPQGTTAESQ